MKAAYPFVILFLVPLTLVGDIALRSAQIAQEEIHETKPAISIKRAIAALEATKGNIASGKVQFIQMDEGVKIIADIDGLTPGKHGFHIHEFGDCSAPDGSSAGGHFDPHHNKHGSPDAVDRHAGDLGNVVADAGGRAHYERIDHIIQLNGPDTIIGRSVIVHANPDDYVTQPTGNAGGRVACGIIMER